MFIIVNPKTKSKLEVAEEDLPDEMTWNDALKISCNLKDNWRIPTKEELKEMYLQLHENGQGNFKKNYYWSSNKYFNDGNAWFFHFAIGFANVSTINYNFYVRLVRDV